MPTDAHPDTFNPGPDWEPIPSYDLSYQNSGHEVIFYFEARPAGIVTAPLPPTMKWLRRRS